MNRHRLKIARKLRYAPDIFGLEFRCPGLRPWPGQFFQVQVDDNLEIFLNRPISIASYRRGRLLLVIRVVGRGTKVLSAKEPGDHITLFGPFGNAFKPARKKSLVIAGGIGMAPLHFLCEHLFDGKIGFDVLYGVRDRKEFIFRRDLKRMAERVTLVAERGYKKKETVTSRIAQMNLDGIRVGYACGPKGMLVALQRLVLPFPVHAFCEDFMGCGCGLCLGCAIKHRGTYRRICVDGPVFNLGEIDFEG